MIKITRQFNLALGHYIEYVTKSQETFDMLSPSHISTHNTYDNITLKAK